MSLLYILLLLPASNIQGQQWWDETPDYGYPDNIALKDGATFDYIVVGAGAAGSTAAARLALAGADVLLVEAGGDPPPMARMPAGGPSLVGSTYDWNYKTISNNQSCLSQKCYFNRGKCLGGSTSINYMLYTRGNRKDFEYNLPGWSWEDLKPYFLRYEGLEGLDQLPASSKLYHNTSGLMKLSFPDDRKSPWHSRIIEAYRQLNFPSNSDVNGETQIGVGIIPGYIYNGERMSTARGFLTRDDVKINLKVAKHALCTGIIIQDKIAKGIKLIQRPSKKTLHIYARKEVILTAGAIGSPHILMLSGIGPAEHIKSMGIQLQADLPVGESFPEHFLNQMFVLVDRRSGLADDLASLADKAEDVREYALNRKGPLSSIGLVDIGTFANTNCYNSSTRRLESGDGCDLPNLQLVHIYVDRYLIALGRSMLEKKSGFTAHVAEQVAAANEKYAVIIICPINLVPYSRGTIRLASANPVQSPEIYPNFLSDTRDLDDAVRSVQLVEDLLKTPAFRKQNAKLLRLKLDCPRYKEDKVGYWRCYVRHMTASGMHTVGTAPLGDVLDEKLRVRGISRLRLADASAMPIVPRGSTEAAAIAFGERVVDFLLEDNATN